jgi:N-alpha-acetyltransferase 50
MTDVSSSRLPFQLGDLNPANLQQLRMLNLSTLPVKYSDKFYRELIDNYSTEYMKYCFWNGFIVGAICARVEGKVSNPEDCKLYIMTINVLAAYRRKGIGKHLTGNKHQQVIIYLPFLLLFCSLTASELLKFALEKAKKDATITEVYLHVQINNSEAKEFYLRNGFEEAGIIKDYYKRIEPADCFILKKSLREATSTIE